MYFVYYCSGHGYGHATRVSAFAGHLLRLDPPPTVHIVSSAPKHVFSDSIALGALYRNTNIDPVIVQPLAYRVDRSKSIEVLKSFLEQTPQKIKDEVEWLQLVNADCVLSDAAFLGCAAANVAGIPSVLITNFTFDSVYSYLSTPFVDEQDQSMHTLNAIPHNSLPPDVPIPGHEVEPLVRQLLDGYRCADLLLRLPGAIPIPSFAASPALPSPEWVDLQTRRFHRSVCEHLIEAPSQYTLLSQIPFPAQYQKKIVSRSVVSAPLLVRSPNAKIYTKEGRMSLLDTLGVPRYQQENPSTKILIVSFGGQIFHKPAHSRTHSRTQSRTHSRTHSRSSSQASTPAPSVLSPSKLANGVALPAKDGRDGKHLSTTDEPGVKADALTNALTNIHTPRRGNSLRIPPNRDRSQSLLLIPGAPATTVPNSPLTATVPSFPTIIPPTPRPEEHAEDPFVAEIEEEYHDEVFGTLLPDESWIAVVCGVPKEWAQEDGEGLPDNFFVAPKDVYMPDLTAAADVLLGKLGYGTVSECVDACTPFVYVPRPLFIEEHGLRLLLGREGVGIELSRVSFENGEWAAAVEEAYAKGKEAKAKKRAEGETGKRVREGRVMAEGLVDWLEDWKESVGVSDARS